MSTDRTRQAERIRFALIHSPLVGPATWRWVAEVLTSEGHKVVVPDLRVAAVTGDPHALISAAAPAVIGSDAPIVVGHSGAGFFLPSTAAAAESRVRARLVFVDAGPPPCEGQATASADFLDRLQALAVDGILPRWSTWWGDDVMKDLVPDESRRRDINAELPEVPLALYETPIAVPIGWCASPAAFVLLSEAYRSDATIARSRGWPVVERLGTHLDIVNDPEGVARCLVEVAQELVTD